MELSISQELELLLEWYLNINKNDKEQLQRFYLKVQKLLQDKGLVE